MHPRAVVPLLVCGLALAACGDELLCPQTPLLLIQSPTATVDTDADPVLPGIQVDVAVRTTLPPGTTLDLLGTSADTVEVANATAVVDDSGSAAFYVTLPVGAITLAVSSSPQDQCEVAHDQVTLDVTTGVFTGVTVAVVEPEIACGSQVSPAVDQDVASAGVQVLTRVTAPGSVMPRVQLTNTAGTVVVDAPTDTVVTLGPGANELRGIVNVDGNDFNSSACTITLADLTVSFAPTIADGRVGRGNGTVTGTDLTLPVCGTVSTTGATVTVAVDGGAAQPATVTGTHWCDTVTIGESPPSHTIVAEAVKGPSYGSATLVLDVDLTVPGDIIDFAANDVNRQRIHMAWTAPSDGGLPVDAYVVKYAFAPITDASFDSVGTILPTGIPNPPGQPETLDLFPARTGSSYWIAAAAVDDSGNRSTAAVVGPITPVFAQTGAITPGDPTAGALGVGWSIASGRFNDDDVTDLAVGAPGETVGGATAAGTVSVFFGGPGGIGATPDVVITGGAVSGRLGTAVAAMQWTVANREDLAIGAPGEGGGKVYVFTGGAGFPTGTAPEAAADITIGVAATPGWFASSNLGSALDAALIDNDAIPDLVIGAPRGGGARGGVVTIYGGTATAASIGLSDVDAAAANGAVASFIEDPAATTGRGFGTYVHSVGPTMGAGDLTDDVVVGYTDDGTFGDWVYLFRPDGTRPASPGVTQRFFLTGRDVKITYTTPSSATGFGVHATSIEDQNGDGARDLVISAYRTNQTLVIDGNLLGTAGAATTADPGVVLTTFLGGNGTTRLGVAIAERTIGVVPDVNGDGLEDLMLVGVTGGVGRFYVWFGGEIPVGSTTITTASYAVAGSNTFQFTTPGTNRGQARWIGDVDGDGLDDVCWAAPSDNNSDGGFEVLDN